MQKMTTYRSSTARTIATLFLATVLFGALSGCGVGRSTVSPKQLDLGAGAFAPAGSLPANPPIVVPAATTAALLNETMVVWRVGNTGQPQAYATYQWVAPPARLVTQRIIDRLSLQGAVLQQSIGGDLPQLRLSLQRFEQTFSEDGATSQGRLTLQVVLVKNTVVVDQVLIDLSVPAGSQDAAGGAVALRQATDQATEQVAQWLAAQIRR